MNRIPALSAALIGCLAAHPPSPASAPAFKSGRVISHTEHGFKFKEPVEACLKLCTKVVVERQTFECLPYFAPPLDGCDLPWIDGWNPNPDYFDQGDLCVPSEPELAGYHLDERVERVERVTTQGADCKAVTTETVVQVLPDRNNPPRRCPGPGAWVSENEQILSIQFIPCR
jgi:hypothetical protein